MLDKFEKYLEKAVAQYWQTRQYQKKTQMKKGSLDTGSRSAVTGGAQMDGFIRLFSNIATETGLDNKYIFVKKKLELPGFFRPTKEWDFLVIKENCLIAAIETKSQVGPSFGNNFNNRVEEALGSVVDLWTAFREGAFNAGRLSCIESTGASKRTTFSGVP